MNMEGNVISAKASNVEDRSSAIIVSFDSRWHSALSSGRISTIIRKRIPNSSYEWIYFHINRPISAICGRAKIEFSGKIMLSEAIQSAEEIGLSVREISTYVGGSNSIGCYKIGSFELAKNSQNTEAINKFMNYSPPQSFLILSGVAKQLIDEMAEFCGIAADGAAS